MPSQAANAALASRDLHYVGGVGPNSVGATLRGHHPKPFGLLPNKRSMSNSAARDHALEGAARQRIDITGLGALAHVALQVALEAVGENPKDFTLITVG
jgi:hypothetical protein